jgi:hypothetical protein
MSLINHKTFKTLKTLFVELSASQPVVAGKQPVGVLSTITT